MNKLDRFYRFVEILTAKTPSLKIKYKDESPLMKLIAKLLFFNKNFMTGYITTIGDSVYFTDEKSIKEFPLDKMITLAHEYVHIKDSHKYTPILFGSLYLFPQIFVLLAIPMLFIIGWWGLLFLLFGLPIPAYFRMRFELNGYNMTLFSMNELMLESKWTETPRRKMLEDSANRINKDAFKGPGYYFMWPMGIQSKFDKTIDDIISGDILKDDIYQEMRNAIALSRK